MNIVNSLPEYTKPKNVGLMFFCLQPERFFPYAQIDVVQFPDGLGGDTINEKTFKGPLHQQLREALLYISNTVIQERVEKVPGVAEARRFFNYPYTAIEEALANAIYHKGYDEREPIEVRVHPDRIEIVSHPGADRSISIDGLKQYRVFNRRYRNRRIGEFLKEMHLTEGRNTGFGKIIRALDKNGSPKPLFETDEDRTFFAATIYVHPGFNSSAVGTNQGTDQANQATNQGTDQALDIEERIMNAIRENSKITQDQIAKKLDVKSSSVKYYMEKMKKAGKITRSGTSQTGEWVILE
jgi:ATP-dependent DNA helicase RecG